MLKIKAKRISEKDLLAFCNELMKELGGGGRDGLKFGRERTAEGKEIIWLFGRKIKTEDV